MRFEFFHYNPNAPDTFEYYKTVDMASQLVVAQALGFRAAFVSAHPTFVAGPRHTALQHADDLWFQV